ncbi:hypothetical protein [Vibrio parahaemolyticus]|uniref:hypothetical protein n=1 Tax=Vibrio parahaemolyticus TaxID=670 RepID=UPI0007A07F4C|nr:hypothetical protein [Vibrio parahaemolyticus]HBC3970023.1 hypothetical protein [Vibrio alginolyticus]EGR2254741.1 hypothetical protein [Vibrio parahaemolyticus]KYX35891.1 hypothetical protein AVO50_13230 [Vibrio parahaemolyticus]WMN85543.1 hypothetical protein NI384_16980 [Vibrio parahaemolyticus]HCE3212132.1 hypothetical protein [Vibrio parahaemolyticus]
MQHSVETSRATGSKLTHEQMEFIKEQAFPSVMEITQASEFDTPFVQTESDRWEYVRLGRRHIEIYDLDNHSNKLLKIVSNIYTTSHLAPLGSVRFSTLKKLWRGFKSISFAHFKKQLEFLAKANKSMDYFVLKAITKTLIRIGFPGFDIDNEEELTYLVVPNVCDPFLRYQDVENTMPSHLKSIIVNRLVEFATTEGLQSLSDTELKNLSVLGLAYAIGPRPQQFSMLKGSSVKLIATNHKTSLKRYEVSVPLAKQIEVPIDEPKVALSQEVGLLIDEYKKRFGIIDSEPLYPYNGDVKNTLSKYLHLALNNALFFIQTDETKRLIELNKAPRPFYTLYDFRHNIGHSMAMLGASAEEIAAVLGQTTTVAAQFYIMSTPDLSLLKHKSLGQNPIWKNMMGLLLTGYSVEEKEWTGKTVSGMLKGKLIHRIGGCNRRQNMCHLAKIRSCYGCFYFRPFKEFNKHEIVLEVITHELVELVKTSHDTGNRNNPLIDTATHTKNEVEMVINRLKGNLR